MLRKFVLTSALLAFTLAGMTACRATSETTQASSSSPALTAQATSTVAPPPKGRQLTVSATSNNGGGTKATVSGNCDGASGAGYTVTVSGVTPGHIMGFLQLATSADNSSMFFDDNQKFNGPMQPTKPANSEGDVSFVLQCMAFISSDDAVVVVDWETRYYTTYLLPAGN